MMYDSGMTVKALIEELKTEIDIATDITDDTYISILNSLQILLYSEIIKEQRSCIFEGLTGEPIALNTDSADADEAVPRFEDIYAVYANMGESETESPVQLTHSTMTNGVIFPYTYYRDEGKMAYHTPKTPESIRIIYFVKPPLLTTENYDALHVGVPVEFIDLVKAKIRGEIYKLANEGTTAANWMNDYNALLENFKAWVVSRQPVLGM